MNLLYEIKDPRFSGPVGVQADSFVVFVERAWKGVQPKTLVGVVTPRPWAFPFETNERYLIYGDWMPESSWVQTESDTRTKNMQDAKWEISQLGSSARRKR